MGSQLRDLNNLLRNQIMTTSSRCLALVVAILSSGLLTTAMSTVSLIVFEISLSRRLAVSWQVKIRCRLMGNLDAK